MLGMLVFVTLDIMPLKPNEPIRNHPHRYTWPCILHGPLKTGFPCGSVIGVPSALVFCCMSCCTFCSLHVTNGSSIGDIDTVPPNMAGNTKIQIINDGIM